jgi:hypothetical protein
VAAAARCSYIGEESSLWNTARSPRASRPGCRCGTEKRGLDPSQRPGSTKAHHALGCLHGIFNRRVALAGNLRPLLIAASIFACCCSRRAASEKRRPQRQLGPSQVPLRHYTRGSANSQPGRRASFLKSAQIRQDSVPGMKQRIIDGLFSNGHTRARPSRFNRGLITLSGGTTCQSPRSLTR